MLIELQMHVIIVITQNYFFFSPGLTFDANSKIAGGLAALPFAV